jgi:iron complex outermembrane receptor protein
MRIDRSIVAVAVAVALGGSAAAQERGRLGLDEIIVTAQKREQDLQDVPIAISAFDAGFLEAAGIGTLDEISMRTPGLTMGRFNAVQPEIFIRGIGSTDQSAAGDASVGVFVDGVFMGRLGTLDFDFFDLARIEVLRGPQGTLYGKNVVGGAINIVTAPPTEEFEARVEAGLGNFSRRSLRGYVNGGITDGVAGKLTASWLERDGYSTNVTTGNRLSDEDNLTLRGQLLFAPTDMLDITLAADWSRDRLAGANRHCAGEQFVFFPWFAPGSPFAASPCSPNPYTNELTIDGYQDRDLLGLSATLRWDTAAGEVTSITAFRNGEYDILQDFSGSDANLVIRNAVDEIDQWSQEIRLGDVAMDGRLDWLVGVYGYRADIDRLENNDFTGNNVPLGLPPTFFNLFFFQENRTTSYAAFTQGTYALTDALSLTAGVRYTYEKKDSSVRTTGIDPFGSFLVAPYDVSASESWTAFTPKLALDWRLSDEVMVYASFAEGFKSGGYNGTSPTAEGAVTPFNQEKARNYELGIKTELFDRRVRANLTAFFIDYQDLQVFQLVDGARLIVENAADAESYGAELEVTAVVAEGLTVFGSYAYLNAEYKNFVNEAGRDFSGNSLTRSPSDSVNVGFTWRRPVGDGLSLALHSEYSYRSRVFYLPDNYRVASDGSLGLLDARVTLGFDRQNIELTLWGKNLTDEAYITQAIDGRGPFNLSQNAAAAIGAPRMYGATLNWYFD